MNLTDILEKVANDTSGDSTTINDVVAQFESRGFGPLLVAPALVAVLPTGAIPTVPSLCAITIASIVIQIVAGKKHPWLPNKLSKLEVSREKLKDSVERFKPYTKRVDKLFKPRLTFVTNSVGRRVVSVIAGLTALMMIPLELVPFAAALPGAAVIFLGVGLSTEDGLMSIVGMFISIISGYVIYTQLL